MARSLNKAPAHAITDPYVDRLALDLDDRLLDGATLTEALEDLLREEAPVTFYDPSDASSSGSTLLKTLLGLGVAAAVGYGLNALLKQQTDENPPPFARDQAGPSSGAGATVYASPALHDDPEEGFRAHHRTTYGDFEAGDFEAHVEDFRSHYHNAYNSTDRAFEDYVLAYRLGFRYGADDEHRTREFEALQPEMRRTYEKEHGEDTFRSVEGAARHAFHRARTVRAQT